MFPYRHVGVFVRDRDGSAYVIDFNLGQGIKIFSFADWIHGSTELLYHKPNIFNNSYTYLYPSKELKTKYTKTSWNTTEGIDCEVFALELLGLPPIRTQWDTFLNPLNIRSTGRKLVRVTIL